MWKGSSTVTHCPYPSDLFKQHLVGFTPHDMSQVFSWSQVFSLKSLVQHFQAKVQLEKMKRQHRCMSRGFLLSKVSECIQPHPQWKTPVCVSAPQSGGNKTPRGTRLIAAWNKGVQGSPEGADATDAKCPGAPFWFCLKMSFCCAAGQLTRYVIIPLVSNPLQVMWSSLSFHFVPDNNKKNILFVFVVWIRTLAEEKDRYWHIQDNSSLSDSVESDSLRTRPPCQRDSSVHVPIIKKMGQYPKISKG